MQLNCSGILTRNRLLRQAEKRVKTNKIRVFGPAASHEDKLDLNA
jgi:hypothetical protein